MRLELRVNQELFCSFSRHTYGGPSLGIRCWINEESVVLNLKNLLTTGEPSGGIRLWELPSRSSCLLLNSQFNPNSCTHTSRGP